MEQKSIRLRHACACLIPVILEAVAERARQKMGPNRPHCPYLQVLRVEDHMLPAAIQRRGTLQSWAIFCVPPSPGDPLGKRLLGVTAALCPGCRAKVAAGLPPPPPALAAPGCAHTPCGGCDGTCCDELVVHFTYYSNFTFLPHEVRWFFYHLAGMHDEAVAALPADYHYTYYVYQLYDADPAAPGGGDAGRASVAGPAVAEPIVAGPDSWPAKHRQPGAPLLLANDWLLNKIRSMPDPNAPCRHLRAHWQELYLQQMGVPPENWDKSFREAVRKCRARLKRERGEK